METILILLTIQGLIGAYDSIYHHEFKERLSLRIESSAELYLHSARSFLYSIIFFSFGWWQWQGKLAILFASLLFIELIITLWDFVIEDKTRHLPSTERVTHTILALNYGAVLALFIPELIHWFNAATAFVSVDYGIYSWIMTVYGLGVIPFAIREFTSARRLQQSKNARENGVTPTISIQPKRILITGGTGFIGQHLCRFLLKRGNIITLLTRDYQKAVTAFGSTERITLIHHIHQLGHGDVFDIIINLAGEPIAEGRWTAKKKQAIIQSRLSVTKQITDFIKTSTIKPKLLISGSAIGYYGPQGDKDLSESSQGVNSFSHQLCQQWETVALQSEQEGVRVCVLRTGIVLGKTGGALAAMLIPFCYGLGGRLGHGRQYMSWIHIDDILGIIEKIIVDDRVSGPVNATAPNPVTNKIFTQSLGKALHRPTLVAIPAFVLRLLLGEVANELFLTGQKVLPKKIVDFDYDFKHPMLPNALQNIVKS